MVDRTHEECVECAYEYSNPPKCTGHPAGPVACPTFKPYESKIIIKGLPDRVNEALNILWEYADDACSSGRTKEEFAEMGYDCTTTSGHYLTFVLPRNQEDVPLYQCDACGGFYERISEEEEIKSYCEKTGKDAKLIRCKVVDLSSLPLRGD